MATRQLSARERASVSLFVILAALSSFSLWEAAISYRIGWAAQQATQLSASFEQARFAVAAEESLERKYRLEPGAEVRARHLAAAAAMTEALRQATALSDDADRMLIDRAIDEHARYLRSVGRMFAAVDAGDLDAANAIDGAEVDSVFDGIETLILSLADRAKDGAAKHFDAFARTQSRALIAMPILFAIGVILTGFFWRTLRDLQREAEESLAREAAHVRSSERRFRALVQNTSDLILICAAPGAIIYQSPAAGASWGHREGALLDEPVTGLAHPDDQPALRAVWEQLDDPAHAGGQTSRSTELRLRDGFGGWRQCELIATNLVHDPSVQGVVVTVRDISERKAFERQLTQQAFYDALTGLPNRVLFHDRLEQALARAGRRKSTVGLLFLDIDNFKLVNDSLGHQAGDELLVEAASRLRACVRAQDSVGRLSGDEFVVILESLTGENDALPVVNAIHHQFSRPFRLDGREVIVTVSIGIAFGAAGPDDAEGLLRNADIAMYRAKSNGRARHVVFDPSMHTDSLARLELENDLRRAIGHNELRVHYQPIVAIDTGIVHEVEALVRWEHPTRGMMPPGEFIPIAEETGLIIPLGLWVLREACRQIAEWRLLYPAEPPLLLSVNLSPRQFQQPSLVSDVALALSEAGLPASCLKLEITESVIMRDAEATIRTLWELKALGLLLAIDDFGTGYSSLSYLKRLPLDVLKIDRSFVNGIGSNSEDTAIVQAIMAMAKSLNLKVTGEGIETEEQAALLGRWGCDRGQGFLFSRPLDDRKTAALLETAANGTKASAAPALTAVAG